MISFRVSVNGKHQCLAGIDGHGVVTSNLTWVSRDSSQLQHLPDEMKAELEVPKVGLTVGGLFSSGEHSGRYCRWLECDLQPGDRIEVQIENADLVDTPMLKDIPIQPRETEQDRVRKLCSKWGWIITEPTTE